MHPPRHRLDLIESVTGYYAGAIALTLLRAGVFAAMPRPRTAARIARSCRLRPDRLAEMLEFLSRATNLVRSDRRGLYSLGDVGLTELSFQLEKFVGAYGPAMHQVGALLRGTARGHDPDGGALAAAFAQTLLQSSPAAPLLRARECRRLLDLACGTGSLLIEMALSNADFRGIGLDESAIMCRTARWAARMAGVSRRVRIVQGNARQIRRHLDGRARAQIDAVHGRSLLNAFCEDGSQSLGRYLSYLRRTFPARNAVFVDYYGELGRVRPRTGQPLGMLQDMAQIASGQGVPPASRAEWRAIYADAGCTLRSAQDFEGSGIRWFIHDVGLC